MTIKPDSEQIIERMRKAAPSQFHKIVRTAKVLFEKDPELYKLLHHYKHEGDQNAFNACFKELRAKYPKEMGAFIKANSMLNRATQHIEPKLVGFTQCLFPAFGDLPKASFVERKMGFRL